MLQAHNHTNVPFPLTKHSADVLHGPVLVSRFKETADSGRLAIKGGPPRPGQESGEQRPPTLGE